MKNLKQTETKHDQTFGAMMDTLFELAGKLHEREKLTQAEWRFLDAFDKYCDSAEDLNELEDKVVENETNTFNVTVNVPSAKAFNAEKLMRQITDLIQNKRGCSI